MGKIKQVVMGDEAAEEAAKKKAAEKRAQKKAAKSEKVKVESVKPEEIVKEVKVSKKESKRLALNASRGKKYLKIATLVDKNKTYSLDEALDLVKKTSYSKFDGSVEVIFNVTEKGLRGIVALPHGTGKQIRVKIADDALIEGISKGAAVDFDILVAQPSQMAKLAKIAKILGPRGLMPNPKTGTIGENPEKLVEALSKGQVNFKTETDFPIIHSIIGKVSFDSKKLEENFVALVKAVNKEKINTIFLKPTMGPAVRVQV